MKTLGEIYDELRDLRISYMFSNKEDSDYDEIDVRFEKVIDGLNIIMSNIMNKTDTVIESMKYINSNVVKES